MKTTKRLNKLHSIYQNAPKRFSGIMAVAIVTVATGAVAMAWGPDRPTYTMEHPADHVTFNSITNNSKYGDERNFVRVKDATAPASAFSDDTQVEPGKDYEVYVYYHNNASSTLNDEAHGKKGIAQNAKLRMAMPQGLKKGERTGITGYISASNATPGEVYDNSYLTSTSDVALRYIPGSAKITSFGAVNGQTLPDSLFNTGALLGYDSLNGVLPGCNEFSGYVTYKFRADAPNFTITKQVSKHGESKWQDKIVAKLGERVDYLISYKNTGSTQQDNVVAKDALPKGMTYVSSSTILANGLAPKGIAQADGLTTSGLKIGSYAPGATAYIKLSATVSEQLDKCGPNDLINYATINTPNGNKQATATVTVDAACKPNECKPGVPEGDSRCATPTEECAAGTVKDEQTGECITAPSTLPTTGPTEIILSLIGLGAMAAGIVYWVKSRKELAEAIAEGAAGHRKSVSAEDAPKLLTSRTETKASDDKKHF